ncbi:MAG: alpha/beta-type small acid-soluble spore protein [Bacillota bacterium]|nr:alpha/beta-type small acid-soluble spore protein [Bacillota bacterium]
MARFSNRPKLLPEEVLDKYKYEVADELGLTPRIQTVGWGDMTSRECGLTGGRIGGRITKVLVRLAEEELAAQSGPQFR